MHPTGQVPHYKFKTQVQGGWGGGKGMIAVRFDLYINPFPPRADKSVHFIILLCLTPDNFTRQRRAPGWERVKVDGKGLKWVGKG